jgi:hypothetical protein
LTRRLPGLHQSAQPSEVPDGLYLVRVEQAQYRFSHNKPFLAIRLSVVEPEVFAGHSISGRLYTTQKALWKLSWFLRDFGYDSELLGEDKLDEKALLKLQGVVKISHTTINGTPLLNLEGFAPSSQWEELSAGLPRQNLEQAS